MIETIGESDERKQAMGKDNRTPFPRHATTTAHQPTPFRFSASHKPLPGTRPLANPTVRSVTGFPSARAAVRRLAFRPGAGGGVKNRSCVSPPAAATTAAIQKSTPDKTKHWDFDDASIFAQIDAFVQRCRDLLEVGEG